MSAVSPAADMVEIAALIGARNWMDDVDYIALPTCFEEWVFAAENYILEAIKNN